MVIPVCDLLVMKKGRAQSTCVIATRRVAAYQLTSTVLIESPRSPDGCDEEEVRREGCRRSISGGSCCEHHQVRDREDRRGCSCRSVADQTCRSRKVVTNANTSVTTITVKSETAQAVAEKAPVIKATEEKSVSSVAETVLKHETVHEVADDSTCSTMSRRVPDRRTLLPS